MADAKAATEAKDAKPAKPRARIARGDLGGLDALAVDTLALPLFEVVKQPTGAAGYVDWRLSGRIARLLLSRRFKGEPGEALLMSSLGRIGGTTRIFLLGLGTPRELVGGDARASVTRMIDILGDAGARAVAFAPPVLPGEAAPAREGLSPRREAAAGKAAAPTDIGFCARATAEWLEACKDAKRLFDELILLDADGSLQRAEPQLQEAAKKSGLEW